MAELDPRVQALLDKDAITTVIQDLARGTDRLDAERIAACYHPDGFDDHNSFRGGPQEFAKWVLEVLPHFAATHHFVAQPRIRLDGDVAQVDTYCIAHHLSKPGARGRQSDLVLGLRYVDRFERRAGSWKIARRVCAFDWTVTLDETSDAKFVFERHFTLGRRDRSDPSYRGA
jgi:ketosteroid isomerase-like protein